MVDFELFARLSSQSYVTQLRAFWIGLPVVVTVGRILPDWG